MKLPTKSLIAAAAVAVIAAGCAGNKAKESTEGRPETTETNADIR